MVLDSARLRHLLLLPATAFVTRVGCLQQVKHSLLLSRPNPGRRRSVAGSLPDIFQPQCQTAATSTLIGNVDGVSSSDGARRAVRNHDVLWLRHALVDLLELV